MVLDTISWSPAKVCGALMVLLESKVLFRKDVDMHRRILLDLAKKFKQKGRLTTKQIDVARFKIARYEQVLHGKQIPEAKIASPDGTEDYRFLLHNHKKFRVYLPQKSTVIEIVNQLHGIQFIADKGYYTCDASKRNGYVLLNSNFVPDKRAGEYMDRPVQPPLSACIEGLKRDLKSYQIQGVSFLASCNGKAILGDDMGLGKTAQAIAWAHYAKVSPILVSCPASVKTNWAREIFLWTGDTDVYQIYGTKPTYDMFEELPKHKWVIINHDLLTYWLSHLKAAKFQAFILDEVQAFKNTESKRTKALRSLCKNAPHLLALSGTPFENRPVELYPIIQLIDPVLFPTWFQYAQEYCDMKRDKYGVITAKGATNTLKLHKILTETCMIRRKKVEVLTELPEKTRTVVPLELSKSDRKLYDEAEQGLRTWAQSSSKGKGFKAEALVKFNELKQLVANLKLPLVFDWIDTYLEAEEKLVVFAHHHAIVERLVSMYKNISVCIDGRVPADKRAALVDKFQNDPKCRLFIGNLKAAGTGITLTAAHDTCTIELGWTSTLHDQAEDRVFRLGQKNAVTAYYLLVDDTVETRIASLIDKKRGMVSEIMDGKEVEDMQLLSVLLKDFT